MIINENICVAMGGSATPNYQFNCNDLDQVFTVQRNSEAWYGHLSDVLSNQDVICELM